MAEQTDTVLYSLLVEFWLVQGNVVGPKIDPRSVNESIELRSYLLDAFFRKQAGRSSGRVGALVSS